MLRATSMDVIMHRQGLARVLIAGLSAIAMTLALLVVGAGTAQAADACTGGYMQMIAHEDDDLLFQSPDLLRAADSGRCVTAVYLTAGDAGYSQDYWGSRESGVMAAYAQMVGKGNSWSSRTQSFGGKNINVRTLSALPNVQLVFMRLPDGFPLGSGSSLYGYQSLESLLWGSKSSITAVNSSASYSASSLRATLTEIMNYYLPNAVRTTDYTGSYGDGDHSDHHAAAYLTHDASDAYYQGHTIASYLGYPATNRSANVSGNDLTRKRDVYYTYSDYDDEVTHGTQDAGWLARQYVSASATTGSIISANAGPAQSAVVGQTVTLDGSKSTGTGLSYKWTQTSGPQVSLTGATSAKPTFQPTTAGSYVFTLTLTSGSSSSTASVTVTVLPAGTTNVARSGATATASSENTSGSQTAAKAIDGVIDGFPNDSTKEWATSGGKAGSWIQLTWPAGGAVTTSQVILYDRPNSNDQVTGGTLTFSDGTTVAVPALDNAGAATMVTFPARTVTSVKFTITSVSSSTQNVGLAEFEVWGTTGPPPPNQAPTAKASASPASAATGQLVTLDASGSSDPEGATLTYAWQASGSNPAAVTLSSASVAKPTFTASVAGSYAFTVTVNDGSGAANATASADVTVVVSVAPPTLVNVARAAGASASASSQNTSGSQTAAKAIDGVISGYPTNAAAEWATVGGKSGSWIQVSFPSATISKVVLYDRPNSNDQVTGGTLTFSDGSTVSVTSLANNGSATTFTFPARTVTSVKLTVTSVSTKTENVGLSEFEIWGTR